MPRRVDLCVIECVDLCVKGIDSMPTNLALNDELIDEARRLGGHRTKRQAVNEALEEYVARRKRKEILRIFGQAEWDSEYDYKRERNRR